MTEQSLAKDFVDKQAALLQRGQTTKENILLQLAQKDKDAGGRFYTDAWERRNQTKIVPKQNKVKVATWEWRTLAQAYEPKPPRAYVVNQLLPLPSLSVPFGSPGALKTMLILDLAVCVASGQDWLLPSPNSGAQSFKTAQAAVLWIDCDNGQDRLERRLAALGCGHKAQKNTPLYFVSFPNPPFVAKKPAAIKIVIDHALSVEAKLIVFDNLGTISGGADENSSQMVAVMAGLRQIAEKAGAAVVCIHHRNKSEQVRAGNSLRGHSSIEGAVDLALLIGRDEGSDIVNVKATKSRDVPTETFEALWTYTRDGAGELLDARFYGLGKPDNLKIDTKQKAILCLENELQSGMTQTDAIQFVKDKTGVGRNKAIEALGILVRENKLRIEQAGNRQTCRYYRVGV